MLTIDGAHGEGGGQIVRSALALALATGTPFRIERIRAGRQRPGLRRQHLTCVAAARTISNAEVEGAELGSDWLRFRPGTLTAGRYRNRWEAGTARTIGAIAAGRTRHPAQPSQISRVSRNAIARKTAMSSHATSARPHRAMRCPHRVAGTEALLPCHPPRARGIRTSRGPPRGSSGLTAVCDGYRLNR